MYCPGIGTYEYNAPERLCPETKKQGYSYPTDIWSLGITLHELTKLENPIRYQNSTFLPFALTTTCYQGNMRFASLLLIKLPSFYTRWKLKF